MVVRGLMGYATSLAALRQRTELVETFADAEPLVRRYLANRDRDFSGEVRRKPARLMNVTAPALDSGDTRPPCGARDGTNTGGFLHTDTAPRNPAGAM